MSQQMSNSYLSSFNHIRGAGFKLNRVSKRYSSALPPGINIQKLDQFSQRRSPFIQIKNQLFMKELIKKKDSKRYPISYSNKQPKVQITVSYSPIITRIRPSLIQHLPINNKRPPTHSTRRYIQKMSRISVPNSSFLRNYCKKQVVSSGQQTENQRV